MTPQISHPASPAKGKLALYDTNTFRPMASWRLGYVPQSLCQLEAKDGQDTSQRLLVGDQDGAMHVLDWKTLNQPGARPTPLLSTR